MGGLLPVNIFFNGNIFFNTQKWRMRVYILFYCLLCIVLIDVLRVTVAVLWCRASKVVGIW